jgi:hypothetical protein
MTDFVLRIFFSGLIALQPSADGKEVTVLLINTPHEYVMAGGATLAHHTPIVLARAANCQGTCVTDAHPAIAQFLYASKTPQQASAALTGALLGGGAWKLAGSDLAVIGAGEPLTIVSDVRGQAENGTPQMVPTTAQEREDFSWVADLSAIAPGTEGFRAALSGSAPPSDPLIAARFKLRSGKLFTYSLVKIDGKARPVRFRKPSGEGADVPYAQALANWVAADIRISGEFVELVETKFTDSTQQRSMKLYPQDGRVEIAILNLPPFEAPAPDAEAPLPAPGQHFEIYYDLVKTPPAVADRLVPHTAAAPSASEPQIDWATLHPKAKLWSDLLEQLNLSPRGKSPYDVTLCPIVRD